MRAAIGFALVLMLTLPATPASQEKGQRAVAKLVGTYRLVSGRDGDKEIPKDRLEGGRVRIARDTITTYDEKNMEVYVIRYSIEREDEPYRIAMTVTRSSMPDAEDLKARGLARVEGDRLTLIYDYTGTDFPSGFEPTGETQNLFVLERIEEK